MNMQDGLKLSRATLEHALAALVFGGAAALVAAGAIAMCLQAVLAA